MAAAPRAKVAAGFLVYRRLVDKTQFLLLKTSYGEKHWSPPKGHLEEGETAFEAGVRETAEESGIKIDQLLIHKDFERRLNYPVNNRMKTVIYWLAKLVDPNTPIVLSEEHTAYEWNPAERTIELAQFDDIRQVYRQADKYLQTIECVDKQ